MGKHDGEIGGFHFSPRPNRAREIAWMPWGDEAFSRAAEEAKPILLSLSAVWCHWCHVMDETTYSDPEVIELINRHYVPVWVDSDRHPDINRRYNRGGWPTTAFLSPKGALLAGTTFIPPEAMRKVLKRIHELYRENREQLEAAPLETAFTEARARPLDASLVEEVALSVLAAWDRRYGGLGREPKFPHPEALLLALRFHLKGGDEYLDFATQYLKAMAEGGLRDAVEGGFFRYSVTGDWSTPHYEKMLDDNARLLTVYLRAYGSTGEGLFLEVAAETASYIYRNLSDGDCRFFGSQDADEEYYKLDASARAGVSPPLVDKTVYLDHSARAASSLLRAAAVTGVEEHASVSLRFLDFAWKECFHPRGGMAHFHDGTPQRRGLLGDQVEVALACQEAFSFTGDPGYLDRASELLELVEGGCLDRESGLLLDSMRGFQPPGLRPEPADLAAVSRAAEALLRQAFLTGNGGFKDAAADFLSSVSGDVQACGYHAAPFALALDLFMEGPLAVRFHAEDTAHRGRFLAACVLSPDHRTLFLPLSRKGTEESVSAPLSADVCGEHVCHLSSQRAEEVAEYLGVRPGIIVEPGR